MDRPEEYIEIAERDGVDISMLKPRPESEQEIYEDCLKKGQVK